MTDKKKKIEARWSPLDRPAAKPVVKHETKPVVKPVSKRAAKLAAKPVKAAAEKPVKSAVAKKAAPEPEITEVPETVYASAPATVSTEKGERIAKRLARVGICSRRDAERMIAEGRVRVDGVILESPAFNVTESSKIMVDNKPIGAPDTARVWRYHKPQGVITTARDPQGRPTVFERMPAGMPRVVSIGRLDFNTEGLLLLTNDGGLARHLELPANAWIRHYRVRVYGVVDKKKLAKLGEGVTISGIRYEPMTAVLESAEGLPRVSTNSWIGISIREGKNREVRKAMEHIGLQVTRLIRVAFGPFQLGSLPRGHVEEVPQRVLREQLGKFLGDDKMTDKEHRQANYKANGKK